MLGVDYEIGYENLSTKINPNILIEKCFLRVLNLFWYQSFYSHHLVFPPPHYYLITTIIPKPISLSLNSFHFLSFPFPISLDYSLSLSLLHSSIFPPIWHIFGNKSKIPKFSLSYKTTQTLQILMETDTSYDRDSDSTTELHASGGIKSA